MAKRKKRAKKGIESLEKQIHAHEEKLLRTEWEPRIDYYKREIEKFRREIRKRKKVFGG